MKYKDELKSDYLSSLRESVRLIHIKEQKDHKEIHNKIIKWFMQNPNPNDDMVHKFAESMGLDPDNFEEHIYMVLSDILTGGRSKDYTGEYDPKELAMGIEIELEHTRNRLVAEKIAKDHLAEIKDYYTRLKKMEAEAGIKD